jgi:hypothetical protein
MLFQWLRRTLVPKGPFEAHIAHLGSLCRQVIEEGRVRGLDHCKPVCRIETSHDGPVHECRSLRQAVGNVFEEADDEFRRARR